MLYQHPPTKAPTVYRFGRTAPRFAVPDRPTRAEQLTFVYPTPSLPSFGKPVRLFVRIVQDYNYTDYDTTTSGTMIVEGRATAADFHLCDAHDCWYDDLAAWLCEMESDDNSRPGAAATASTAKCSQQPFGRCSKILYG